MHDIKTAAHLVGIPLVPVRVELAELATLTGPKICHLVDPSHFAVMICSSASWVQLIDDSNVAVVPFAEMQRRYSGHALILDHTEANAGGPRLSLHEFHHPFGIAGIGQEIEYSFKVTNAGDEELVVGLQSYGCGAPGASIGKEALAPGESTEVRVKFTVAYSGNVMKSVKLVTNDLTQPIAFLTLHGKVPHDLRVYPDRLFLASPKGDPLSAPVTLSGPAEMQLTEASTEKGLFRVDAGKPQVSEDQKKTWQVALTLKSDTFVGEIADQLLIRTTHKERPLITVPITGTVRGDLQLYPPSAYFGFVRAGEPARATITLTGQSGTPFKLLKAEPSDASIQVTTAEADGGYRLEITLPTDKLGVFEGTITLTTDVPGEETIRIPVYAHVVPVESDLAPAAEQ